MSECMACGQEMTSPATTSCVRWPIYFDDPPFDGRDPVIHDGPGRCPDCNVAAGGYHHAGCDRELCPKCYRPLLSCACRGESAFFHRSER